MTRDQKIVLSGALSGIAVMAGLVWLVQQLLPVPSPANVGDKLAYAVAWDAVAAVPYLIMLASVGNARFFSEAIDPTLGKESQRMVVDGRVADNSTQQLLLFVIASAALAIQLPAERLPIIGAAATTFATMRIAFWVGYRIHPLYGAFGFAGTAYLNLGLLAAAIWLAVA